MIDAALLAPLYDLLTVASEGSVAAAAARLHKTPSAVSQQIRRAETAFGVRLLERDGRGVRLSACGEEILVPLTRLFDHARDVFDRLAKLAGSPPASLRLAASDYLGRGLLAPVLRALGAAGEALRFEILTVHSRDSVELVLRGQVDLAVITSAESRHGLEERPLFEQPFFWVAPRTQEETSLDVRLGEGPVLLLAPGSVGRRVLDGYLSQHAIRPASTIDVPSVSLLLSYAMAGVGIGLVPALSLVDADTSAVTVEPAAVAPLPVKIVVRPGSPQRAGVERLIEGLVAEAVRVAARIAA